MKKTMLLFATVLLLMAVKAQDCGPFHFRNYNIQDTASLEVIGKDTFRLSAAYPAALPEATKSPWEKIDFTKRPEKFMQSVLGYCWEGNEEVDFKVQQNETRAWFHAPLLDYGYAGREPMRGLTMDYTSFGEDFRGEGSGKARNYSITFYNDVAAYTLGQVWCDPKQPDASKAQFKEGAVFFSLVFTTGDSAMFPFLSNAYKWEALVEQSTRLPIEDKKIDDVSLFEVHFAVRTGSSKAPNGWVLGSFLFDGATGNDTKGRLRPFSLQWGNDPGVTPQQVRAGEASIKESWTNPALYNPENRNTSVVKHGGYAGRAQRPIGHSDGSLLSEAMTASWPVAPALPPANIELDSILHWHRNIGPATPFYDGSASLDYSLELAAGLRNHAIVQGDSALGEQYLADLEEVLGFFPPDKSNLLADEEEEVIEYDTGLEGRNLYVFIGFLVLVIAIVVMLVLNLLRDNE